MLSDGWYCCMYAMTQIGGDVVRPCLRVLAKEDCSETKQNLIMGVIEKIEKNKDVVLVMLKEFDEKERKKLETIMEPCLEGWGKPTFREELEKEHRERVEKEWKERCEKENKERIEKEGKERNPGTAKSSAPPDRTKDTPQKTFAPPQDVKDVPPKSTAPTDNAKDAPQKSAAPFESKGITPPEKTKDSPAKSSAPEGEK